MPNLVQALSCPGVTRSLSHKTTAGSTLLRSGERSSRDLTGLQSARASGVDAFLGIPGPSRLANRRRWSYPEKPVILVETDVVFARRVGPGRSPV